MRLVIPLICAAALGAQVPSKWFTEPILPEEMRRSEMYAFVNSAIAPLPRFTSRGQWEQYKAALKPRILCLLGIEDILANHSLRVVSKGTLERDGYTIEKINYESYPGMWVPALVWAPKGLREKAPAMVSISGHFYCDSKANEIVQARNYNLVRRGFIVVSYDYFGCFERARLDPCLPGAWGGEDHTNSLFSYTRRTPTGIEALDGIRAIDYLYSRRDVDRTRVGFTGESGGGNSTYWVSALDDRVTLSVPVSSAGAYEQWIKADTNYDWHQRPPGIRAFADIGTLYALAAPRPILIINGRPELAEFALPDAQRSFAYAKDIYRLYGAEDRIVFLELSSGHGYQSDKRLELYRWVNRWFFGGRMPHSDQELPYPIEPKESLRAGLPEGNLSIPALARRWVAEAAPEWPLPASGGDARDIQTLRRQQLTALLGLTTTGTAPPLVIFRAGDSLSSGNYVAERLQFELTPDLVIPGLFVRKGNRTRSKTVLCLEKRSRESCESLLANGYAVLFLDVRGTGEMLWGGDRTASWANLVGRPPIGMWVEDVSRVTGYLLSREDVESVAVLGDGLFGKVALYAAALDPRIAAAALTTDSLSYREEATAGFARAYADVPRILSWGDTPQLAALIAPRPLVVLGASALPGGRDEGRRGYFSPSPRFVTPAGLVSEATLAANYEWTKRFYEVMGARGKLATGPRSVVEWFRENF